VRLAGIRVPKRVTPCRKTTMFKQEGYDLMGAAFEVYSELGCGMAGEIYQAALESARNMKLNFSITCESLRNRLAT